MTLQLVNTLGHFYIWEQEPNGNGAGLVAVIYRDTLGEKYARMFTRAPQMVEILSRIYATAPEGALLQDTELSEIRDVLQAIQPEVKMP